MFSVCRSLSIALTCLVVGQWLHITVERRNVTCIDQSEEAAVLASADTFDVWIGSPNT